MKPRLHFRAWLFQGKYFLERWEERNSRCVSDTIFSNTLNGCIRAKKFSDSCLADDGKKKYERGARDRSEMFFFLSLDEEDENGFTFGHTWILLLFRLRSWHDYDKV